MPQTTKAAPAPAPTPLHTLTIPRIGAHWPAHGGIFVGIVAGADGQPDTLLILGPESPHRLTHHDALAWAAQLTDHRHSDWALPNRREQSVLYGNCKGEFKEAYYWSCTQVAGLESYAWLQGFGDGGQGGCHKNYEFRARAVRRLPLQ